MITTHARNSILPMSRTSCITSAEHNLRAFPGQTVPRQKLSSQVNSLLKRRFDASVAINFLSDATEGDIYVCGGTIRRGLFGDSLAGDIDIIVPNGDDRAVRALDSLEVSFALNSNGHRRYRWNYLEIDIFQPCEFFGGFNDVKDALLFFDLKINALAWHCSSDLIVDPFQIISDVPVTDPGINWRRWEQANPQHLIVLAMRLAKILHEVPSLNLKVEDVGRLLDGVLPRISGCHWNDVRQRFPLGKAAFLHTLEMMVISRVSEHARTNSA